MDVWIARWMGRWMCGNMENEKMSGCMEGWVATLPSLLPAVLQTTKWLSSPGLQTLASTHAHFMTRYTLWSHDCSGSFCNLTDVPVEWEQRNSAQPLPMPVTCDHPARDLLCGFGQASSFPSLSLSFFSEIWTLNELIAKFPYSLSFTILSQVLHKWEKDRHWGRQKRQGRHRRKKKEQKKRRKGGRSKLDF